MAELGKIYWGLDGTTLYLSGEATENADTLWEQSINEFPPTPPWVKTFDSVVFESEILPRRCSYFFSGSWSNPLTFTNLEYLNTSRTNEMTGMFYGVQNTALDLSSFNTAGVLTMNNMFENCSNLTSVDLSSFNTASLRYSKSMFSGCTSLTFVDLSSFTTENLVNTESMFDGCTALTTIYAHPEANWNTSTLTTSTDMFNGCTSLVGGNGTPYSSSYKNKTYARIDKSGQKGYFTVAQRTLSTSYTGQGSVTGGGTYDYGTAVTVQVTPDLANYYYTDSISRDGNIISDTDTLQAQTFSLVLTKNTSFDIVFGLRENHTLTLTTSSAYTVQGGGTYRYLDRPTAYINLGGGLVAFDGWYNGSTNVSSANPYTFTMPNEDYTLDAVIGGEVFTKQSYRQFALQNGDGQVYKLTAQNFKIYLNNPTGLGFKKSISSERIGNSEIVSGELYSMPEPQGELLFYKDSVSGKYEDYFEFARFCSRKPITLWYKLPVSQGADLFYIPVEVMQIAKSEVSQDTIMKCAISFHGTKFWKYAESNVTAADEDVEIYNAGDFPVGVNITLSKTDGTPFDDPIISFSQNGEEYGAISISHSNLKSVQLITDEAGQNVILTDSTDAIVVNPFAYIDFSYANGSIQFPFPKLAQGYSTITFTYANSGTENRNYIVLYDEEYMSV